VIFNLPSLESRDHDVLGLIREQRSTLNYRINQNPNRWTGFLRRNTFARAVQGSNSIEGYNATLAEAIAIVDEERPETLEDETTKALQGYRTALTYILRTHNDPHTRIDAGFVRSLHFMMLNYDLTKLPGQWRPGSIFVVHEPSGERVYEGPDAELVPALIDELLNQIQDGNGADVMIRAAMAHLNLTMIHPFRDGNGRMSRALQTLVLAKDGIISPEFSSIEEWLGRNTMAYYEILASVGLGTWNPERDASPWVRLCLKAHYQQAATIIKRHTEIGRIWQEVTAILTKIGAPERSETALVDATFGFRVRNSRYRADHGISEVVASRDLKRLCDLDFLIPVGEKRGRYYTAGKPLLSIREKCRDRSKAADPYELISTSPGPRRA
jgi:Fic family protein